VTAIGNIEVDDQIIDQLFKLPVKTNSTIIEAKQEMENIDIPEFTLNANDQRILGDFYKTVDTERSFYWYKKSAEQGNADAQFRVGVMYDNGQGVTEDKKQAFHWYKKAAEQGNVSAQFNLGSLYEEGAGVDKNKEEAAYWYRKAYKSGHSRAGSRLSMRSLGGVSGGVIGSIFKDINNKRDK
jgi:TPR repeat protein